MAEEFTCDVDSNYRFVCEGLDFYGEYEGKRYCVLHFPGAEKKEDFNKIKESKLAQKDYRFNGAVFPEGTSGFGRVEFDAPVTFVGAAFVGANFQRTTFSGWTSFEEAKFSGGLTTFLGAEFSGWTSFKGAKFSGALTYFVLAQFSGVLTYFQGAQFSAESTSFARAQFSGEATSFAEAQFKSEETSFAGAQFKSEDTNFQEATFEKKIDFSRVIFREKVSFWGSKAKSVFGPEAWARFDRSRIEKPEQFTFNTVLLHPGWFINADVRKVDFTDVKWYGMPGGIPEGTLDGEIDSLKKQGVESPHSLLAQACRRLSANAEDNREYPLANRFHYWSMNALRKESWHYRKETWDSLVWIRKNWRRVARRCGWATPLRLVWGRINRRRRSRPRSFGLIATFYWALNGYGVRPARAFGILFVIWLVFAALYFLLVESSPFWVCSASGFWQRVGYAGQAAVYSLSALVRLNPRPQSEELNWFQTLVTIEGILGPLQIALLVLAVRRKVMR